MTNHSKTIGIDASRYNLPNPTGVEKYTDQIIEAMLRTKWGKTKLRFYIRTLDQEKKIRSTTKSKNITTKLIRLPYLFTLLGLTWEMRWHPVDMLIIPSHVPPLITPKKTIATIHAIEALLHPRAYSWFARTYQEWTTKRMLAKKNHIIAVSNTTKNDLIRHLEADPHLITVIHNGFTPPARMTDLQTVTAKYHLPDRFVLHIGRIEPRKNQISLIKAFEDIAIEAKDLHLILAGTPTRDGEEAIHLAKKSRFSNRIHLLNYVPQEDLNRILQHTTIFAFPSLAEGFGFPILEAMSLGIPVLTSKGTACEEVAGEAAILVDPCNIESIKEGLQKLLSDHSLYNRLVYAGQERAKEFNWAKSCNETIKLLKSLL